MDFETDAVPPKLGKEEIALLPIKKYDGAVQVVNDDQLLQLAMRQLGHEKVVGFDIECRPAFARGESHPPAVVQIAAAARVFIIQIKHLKDIDPLTAFLSQPRVIKTGVGIDDDVRKLLQIMTFKPAGFLELGKMAAKAGIQSSGIRTLAANLFGFRITKGSARLSNWERDQLTPAQIVYAATDAWICREIYLALKKKL